MNDDPTSLIIGAVVVTTITTVVRNARNKTKAGKTFEPIVFGFLLALALLAIAFVFPKFAKGLAIMLLVGAFVVNGPSVFEALSELGGKAS